MRDSLALFDKTLQDYADSKNVQNQLIELVESLYNDLETERKTTANLQQHILNLTKQDVLGFTSKFASLKEDYAVLREKLADLKNENDDLNVQLIAKNEEAKRLLKEKEEELKSYYSVQLKQKEENMKEKELEIKASKESLKQREKEFYNEIQATEVSSAVELNKLESDFRKQLGETNKKLKESMETCHVLRMELMSVKEQFVEYKRDSSEKISELHKRLRDSQNSENSDSVCQPKARLEYTKNYKNNDDTSKYQPLDVSLKNLYTPDDRPINLKKVPVYRSSGKHTRNENSTLPPLINLKTNQENKSSIKKRKLFNPDDLTYLNMNFSGNDK